MGNGTPGRIRTPNLMVRSHAIYPVDLRAHPNRAAHPAKAPLTLQVDFIFTLYYRKWKTTKRL